MFADQFAGAVSCAPFSDLNDLSHKLWKAHAAGHLSDDQAQALAETIQAKKGGYQHIGRGAGNGCTGFLPARGQRSPDKQASIERRRRLAACWPLPPTTAAHFTLCEQAVLRVLADEMRRYGSCAMFIDKVAAVAGTCRTVVKNTLRKARALRLLTVEERRRRGQRSLTNIVRFLCKAWRAWIVRKGSGVRFLTTANQEFRKNGTSLPVESFSKRTFEVEFARSVPP